MTTTQSLQMPAEKDLGLQLLWAVAMQAPAELAGSESG